MEDLQTIGITKEQEELFLMVKKAIGNDSDLERNLENDPIKIYFACEQSGLFSESELLFLKQIFKMPNKSILQRIKEYFGL